MIAASADAEVAVVRSPPVELTGLLAELSELAGADRRRAVDELRTRWSAARLRLLLVGEAKRGKSTMGNALLRRSVLPTGSLPLTAVATTVRTGEPERVEVRLLDGSVRTDSIDQLDRYVTESRNPHNLLGVQDVLVHLPSTSLDPCVDLVDTPGIGSVFTHNTRAAETSRRSVDVAVLVVGADPPITATECRLLGELHVNAARTFLVVNKIDQLADGELSATMDFTRAVAREVSRTGEVPVFPLSAGQAVRALTDRDEKGWRTSGMASFTAALKAQLARTWRDDLAVGVAGTALREVAELVDEEAVVVRTHELLDERRQERVTGFRAALDRLTRFGDDAAAAADTILVRSRHNMDTDAVAVLPGLTATVQQDLHRIPGGTPAAVESLAWATMAESVTHLVDEWRTTWSDRHAAAAAAAAIRVDQLLDGAMAQVRDAAAEIMGIALISPGPMAPVPESATFSFDVGPEIGWTQPLSSALRRHLPGAVGRRRMRSYLDEEAARMIDKHIGRARSDFQTSLARIRADLRRSAVESCRTRSSRLAEAARRAEESTDDASSLAAAVDRLVRLRRIAAELAAIRSDARSGTAAPAGPIAVGPSGRRLQFTGDPLAPAEPERPSGASGSTSDRGALR